MSMDMMKAAFSDYYKREYRRSEACLGDIVSLLSENPESGEAIDLVLERLIVHYKREDL